jgi:SAM-dependent methyltransferase
LSGRSKWIHSQAYERSYKEDQWGVPYSEGYWLRFMGIDEASTPALEIGCGEHGLWRFNPGVLGLDPIGYGGHGSSLIQGVAERIPFSDGAFRDVYCVNALDHCEDPAKAMREMTRVCGGRVVVWCYVFDGPLKPLYWLLYRPHPHCLPSSRLLGMVPLTHRVTLLRYVDPLEAFGPYARHQTSMLKLRLASRLGVRAALLHLERVP